MKLLEPLQIKNYTIKNRIVMPPMDTNFANPKGFVTNDTLQYYEQRAKGGIGLIYIEGTFFDDFGKGTARMLSIREDDKIQGLSTLANTIKKYGATVIIQLFHAGSQTSKVITGNNTISASPVPCQLFYQLTKEVPSALTVDEIKEITKKYGDAAVRAEKAGFNGIEIHAAHGYLLSQFLSPFNNKRTDQYGGDIKNRMRFLVEVYVEIRKRVRKDFLISLRLNGSDFIKGGFEIEETKIVAKAMEENGVDIISISAGTYDSKFMTIPYMNEPRGVNIKFAAEVKKIVSKVPIIGVGRINDPALAEQLLRDKKADLIAFGRQSFSDPEFANKIKNNKLKDINQCIACLHCIDKLMSQAPIECAINPNMFESESDIKKSETPKKILVVGAGAGGLYAAKLAKLKGHNITLIEKSDKIGGSLNLASIAPGKNEISILIDYYKNKIKELNIDLRLNTEISMEFIEEIKPDVILFATGTIPTIPPIRGLDTIEYKTYVDILDKNPPLGNKILILGGGMVGLEAAELLVKEKDKEITIIEQMNKIGSNVIAVVANIMIPEIKANKSIKILTDTKVEEIIGNKAICKHKNEIMEIEFDNFIVAAGATPNKSILNEIREKGIEVQEIGDCKKPRKIVDAVKDAYKIVMEL